MDENVLYGVGGLATGVAGTKAIEWALKPSAPQDHKDLLAKYGIFMVKDDREIPLELDFRDTREFREGKWIFSYWNLYRKDLPREKDPGRGRVKVYTTPDRKRIWIAKTNIYPIKIYYEGELDGTLTAPGTWGDYTGQGAVGSGAYVRNWWI